MLEKHTYIYIIYYLFGIAVSLRSITVSVTHLPRPHAMAAPASVSE